jgi:hypothetical protein
MWTRMFGETHACQRQNMPAHVLLVGQDFLDQQGDSRTRLDFLSCWS